MERAGFKPLVEKMFLKFKRIMYNEVNHMKAKVLEVLRKERRATVGLIAKKLGASPQAVYNSIVRLCAEGKARRISRGLYEVTEGDESED